jgi:hypothetical protein
VQVVVQKAVHGSTGVKQLWMSTVGLGQTAAAWVRIAMGNEAMFTRPCILHP